MRFAIIKPAMRHIETVDEKTLQDAEVRACLDPSAVDHGMVLRAEWGGIGVVVFEFSLFEPWDRQHYFSMRGRLYGGGAVLYAFNEAGDTIDLDPKHYDELVITWFPNAAAVEAAIAAGVVKRPQMAVDGDVFWRWPQPKPKNMT